MKPKSMVSFLLGVVLFVFGIIGLFVYKSMGGIVPLLFGGSLIFLGYHRGKLATLIFGHTCVIVGCFLVTWGIYLLPVSKPIFAHIVGRPLFWGLFSIFGGICANYHGFCQCVRKPQ